MFVRVLPFPISKLTILEFLSLEKYFQLYFWINAFSFTLMGGVSTIQNENQGSIHDIIPKIDSLPKLYFDYDEIIYYHNDYNQSSEENRYDRYPSKQKVDILKHNTF